MKALLIRYHHTSTVRKYVSRKGLGKEDPCPYNTCANQGYIVDACNYESTYYSYRRYYKPCLVEFDCALENNIIYEQFLDIRFCERHKMYKSAKVLRDNWNVLWGITYEQAEKEWAEAYPEASDDYLYFLKKGEEFNEPKTV